MILQRFYLLRVASLARRFNIIDADIDLASSSDVIRAIQLARI
jgi:hypothetical protein